MAIGEFACRSRAQINGGHLSTGTSPAKCGFCDQPIVISKDRGHPRWKLDPHRIKKGNRPMPTNDDICGPSTSRAHGVSWSVWDREDPDVGPWPCVTCGTLVEVNDNDGFRAYRFVITEEPW